LWARISLTAVVRRVDALVVPIDSLELLLHRRQGAVMVLGFGSKFVFGFVVAD
jgi:hypothetical protein